jgi:maleylacetoacetate isomerase
MWGHDPVGPKGIGVVIIYTYWRSSAAYRLRIALNLKGLGYDSVPVDLVRDGGEQLTEAFRAINPNAAVPAMRIADGTVLTQSLAIIEYLEEQHPDPPLLPRNPVLRARVRAATQLIASDIHPINNLRVLRYLKDVLGHSQDGVVGWMRHWMRSGLATYGQLIDPDSRFSFGDAPSLADICLVPQLYNARRWELDMTGLEPLRDIAAACATIPAFRHAAPECQPDAR